MINDMNNKIAGNSKLVLENKPNGTVATTVHFVGASKVSPAIFLGREKTPCYFLLHLGGGYVEGEIYKNSIEVKKDAKAIITTQAPTKVYKCEKNREPACQETIIKMEENSVLEYISDSVILYKNAMYNQDTTIYMDKKATLIYTDGITSGWSPDKKRFQYEKAKLKTNIYMDGVPVLLDNMLINPREDDIDGLGFMEGYKNFATLIILDDRIDKNIIEHLREEILKLNLDLNFGITGLEVNGFVLRVIGNLTQDLEEVVGLCHNYIRRKVLNSQNLTIRKL